MEPRIIQALHFDGTRKHRVLGLYGFRLGSCDMSILCQFFADSPLPMSYTNMHTRPMDDMVCLSQGVIQTSTVLGRGYSVVVSMPSG